MNWLKHLNEAMEYIEEHLTDTVSVTRAARIAGCAEFQLLRMFPYLTGLSLAEYIRRRRMTYAARDLIAEDTRIIDIAARYGYDSPTSFSRAFRAVHGAAPSEVRHGKAHIVTCPRLIFALTVKGAETMKYRIEKLPEFRAVGIADPAADWDTKNANQKAIRFWEKLGSGVHRILDLMDGSQPAGLLGLMLSKENGNTGQYMAAVATSVPCPESMTERTVPAATYAVFECTGPVPDSVSHLWFRIMTEWLPSSGYTWAATGDIERYLTPKMISPDARSEIWIPVEMPD